RGASLVLSRVIVPALLLWLLLRLVGALRRAFARRPGAALGSADRLRLLTGGPLLIALAIFVAAHRLIGALYPQDRWGLYLILVFILASAGLAADGWAAGGGRRVAAGAALAVLWCVLLQNVVQIQARSYYVWVFDSGTAELFADLV